VHRSYNPTDQEGSQGDESKPTDGETGKSENDDTLQRFGSRFGGLRDHFNLQIEKFRNLSAVGTITP
jgi:hypothetical protein